MRAQLSANWIFKFSAFFEIFTHEYNNVHPFLSLSNSPQDPCHISFPSTCPSIIIYLLNPLSQLVLPVCARGVWTSHLKETGSPPLGTHCLPVAPQQEETTVAPAPCHPCQFPELTQWLTLTQNIFWRCHYLLCFWEVILLFPYWEVGTRKYLEIESRTKVCALVLGTQPFQRVGCLSASLELYMNADLHKTFIENRRSCMASERNGGLLSIVL